MSKPDGGPAFPVEVQNGPDGKLTGIQTSNFTGFEMGMTLRDYFAAKAMASWVQNGDALRSLYDKNSGIDHLRASVASISYAYADAMLTAREA
jgi:hypothetical protein